MSDTQENSYSFDGFLFDPETKVLFRGAERVDLTPKAAEILRVLLTKAGSVVTKEEVMREVWADSFVEEANLSHHIFKLRQALGDGESRKIIETVPKRGYRFVGDVVHGDRRSDDSGTLKSSRRSRPWLLAAIILGALVILSAVGWFAFLRKPPSAPVPARNIKTIAVMPFVNESGNVDVDYLADGMTETLISSLSQVKTLSVKPRAAVFRYKGQDLSAAAAGSELSVQAVLSGRITQRGDELTLFLSLIDTQTEYQVWGKQYVRKLSELASFQNEIGREVALNLEARLSGPEEQILAKNFSNNAEAYRLYLLGRFYWNKFTGEGVMKAIEAFEASIKLDPNYAHAYAGLADAYTVLGVNGHIPVHEAAPKVREAASRSVELGTDVAAAHQAMGAYRMFFEWDLKSADGEFIRAIQLDPNYATAHELYSYSLLAQRRNEDALAEIKKAAELEPTSLIILGDVASAYRFIGQPAEALKVDRRVIEMDPNYAQSRFGMALALSRLGDSKAALEEINRGVELSGGDTRMKACLGIIQARAGNESAAQEVVDDLLKNSASQHVSPVDIALVYSAMGKKDRAFEWLEKAYEERACWLFELNADPDWEPLRTDPRFQDLVRRIGLD